MEGFTLVKPAQWPAQDHDGLVLITNGRDTVSVLIDAQTDMDGSIAPDGFFTLSGVLDQTEEYGRALRPRQLSDFVITTGVDQMGSLGPQSYSLEQNYPNPFNASTLFIFTLAQTERVKLTVRDILGREVAMVCRAVLPAGSHQFRFDGSQLASGLYYYQLETASFTACKKMLLLR